MNSSINQSILFYIILMPRNVYHVLTYQIGTIIKFNICQVHDADVNDCFLLRANCSSKLQGCSFLEYLIST